MTGSRKILIVGAAITAAAILESIKLPDRTTRPDVPPVDPFDDIPIPYVARPLREKDWKTRDKRRIRRQRGKGKRK